MRRFIVLALDVLVDQVILALVVEDDVHFLRRVAADVGPEHDIVLGLAVHVLGGDIRWEDLKKIVSKLAIRTSTYFDIATTAVNLLLMLNSKLDDQILALVGESGEPGRIGIELGIGRCFETFHVVPLARFEHERAIIVLVL